MPKYRWIVFDADGTLFDYEHAELSALRSTLEHFGMVYSTEIHRIYVDINARLWDELESGNITSERLRVQRFEELADQLKMEIDACLFSRDYLLNLGRDATLLANAMEVVKTLSARFKLVLATNGIADVQRSRFSLSQLEPFFHAIVISDEIGVAKPDSAFFDEMFSRMGSPEKTEVLMVGDNLSSDIVGGSRFGIDTCWFNAAGQSNGNHVEPTYEIKSLSEVITIVNSG